MLPVVISADDDRINSADACCVVRTRSHPLNGDLPFEMPPLVAGYNRFSVKPEGQEILSVARFTTSTTTSGAVEFVETSRDPWLVIGVYGDGRTAALASDLAPHWAPPEFVGWDGYGRLWRSLLGWLAKRG